MRTMQETAAQLLSPGKGLLVADEYAESLGGSASGGLPALVDLALRSSRLASYVSGLLLTAHSFAAREPSESADGSMLVGTRLAPPSDASDGPRRAVERLAAEGADFVEWRANRRPHDVRKGDAHIDARALARGAAAAQAAGVLPIITIAMPDIGNESIGVTEAVTTNALVALQRQLAEFGVDARALVLRVNAVAPGVANPAQANPRLVAQATLRVLERGLPEDLPGVLILSGGRALVQACENLAAITSLATERSARWRITFGFSRPLFAASVGVAEGQAAPDAGARLVDACRRASDAVHDPRIGIAS